MKWLPILLIAFSTLNPDYPPQAVFHSSLTNLDIVSSVYLPIMHKSLPSVEMVSVPGGRFQMGCSPQDRYCHANEHPLHSVKLSPFLIDKYEVSNAYYAACVVAGACTPPPTNASVLRPDYFSNPIYADYPVIAVTWYQASDYCAWQDKRLPTEAEWEKAARGDRDVRIFPWGDGWPDCSILNARASGGYCVGDTVAVGGYPQASSPNGAMQMAGNVWEWVADWYDPGYYQRYPIGNWPKDPQGPESGVYQSIRSGAWDIAIDGARVSRRVGGLPYDLDTSTGFRCAR
ncbi:MAG: formylglycine-generating enzyme family protein [Anaerolineales bacterium]